MTSNLTQTEVEKILPKVVVDAWWWLDTFCRHWATVGRDQQTLDNLNKEDRRTAEQHLETLEQYGLIETRSGFRGNFVKRPLAAAVATVGASLLFGCSTIPGGSIPCLDIKVQVCPVKTNDHGR
jgi:hypothetical protein